MTDGSPAWKPHATFALETTSSSASSSPSVQRPKLSPISLFISIRIAVCLPSVSCTAIVSIPSVAFPSFRCRSVPPPQHSFCRSRRSTHLMPRPATCRSASHHVFQIAFAGDEHVPRACVIANSGFDAITAACGVTPHAQNTGTSPGSNTGASAIVGMHESSMPIADGSPHIRGHRARTG